MKRFVQILFVLALILPLYIQVATSALTAPTARVRVVPISDSACPSWTDCPLDGAQSNLVDTEYQGIVAIGVYEHTTTTGQTHRFRMRCN